MIYSLYITRAAEKDIAEAAEYIEYSLLNPKAVDDLLAEIEETLPRLAEMPKRNDVVSDPVLNAWGIRFTQIKNYLAFYVVDDHARRVVIVRFLYMKRDWMGILRGGILES